MKKLPEYTSDDNMFFYMNALVDLVNSQQEAIEKLEECDKRARKVCKTLAERLNSLDSTEPADDKPEIDPDHQAKMIEMMNASIKNPTHIQTDTHRTDKLEDTLKQVIESLKDTTEGVAASFTDDKPESLKEMSYRVNGLTPPDDTHRTVTLRIPKGRTLVEAMFYANLGLDMSDNEAAQALEELEASDE